ncbi:MAG: TolC family protein [Bacteroidales bacterium]|nr:TolC family protein [Bacteroidales bacterium]
MIHKSKILTTALAVVIASSAILSAQQRLSLEDCRRMALEGNLELKQTQTKIEMAGYDRKIALANYFPNISVTGAYMHNNQDIALINNDMSARLQGLGTAVGGKMNATMQSLQQAIMSNPALAQEYMSSPMWQLVMTQLGQTDIASTIGALGQEIDKSFHVDIENMFVGAISLQQPIFMGGKIIAANKIAALAEELSKSKYDISQRQLISDVDKAYWQIVSIAAKERTAEVYADLLHKMERDAQIAADEGMYTGSDVLQVKVKANEADMLLSKAKNGLSLAKMLLCKQIGLPLDSDIVLDDELSEDVARPVLPSEKSMDQVYADRPEIKSLELAGEIYDNKVKVVRADMLPHVALTVNYVLSNPNPYNGFNKEWGGMLNAGVMVNIPIFHGFERLNKTRKAKAEASLYKLQLQDAKEMVSLQVSQLSKQQKEALDKLNMAESALSSAEENMRQASIGFEEGVITTNVALAAQSAWLKAKSDLIDAGIELQINTLALKQAQGSAY